MAENDQPIIKQDSQWFEITVIPVLIVICAAVITKGDTNSLNNAYFSVNQIWFWILTTAWLALIVGIYLNLKRIWVYADRIEWQNVFFKRKRILYFKNITGWVFIEPGNLKGSAILYLYNNKQRFSIAAVRFSDFEKVKQLVTQGIPESEEQLAIERTKRRRLNYIGYAVVVLFIALIIVMRLTK